MNTFDLDEYWQQFELALANRYKRRFAVDVSSELVFTNIGKVFEDLKLGHPLTIDHVMAIFSEDLPFADDWTTPDRALLGARMTEHKVAALIQRLADDFDNPELIGKIRYCFRELSLTSLVLHHVYPTHFAICSHHLASLLYITAPTVPQYYIKYCQELRAWSKRARKTQFSAVKTEFALWTWYRLAHFGEPRECEKNRRAFFTDSWVQERRAKQIADSFKDGSMRPLDLARSFLESQPTISAMIAWREFETVAKELLRRSGDDVPDEMWRVIERLPMSVRDRDHLQSLRKLRNRVTHEGREINKADAERVLAGVVGFIEGNAPEFR